MKSLVKLSVLVIGIGVVAGCSSPSTSTNPQVSASASSSVTPSTAQAVKLDSEKKSGDSRNHNEGDVHGHTEAVKVGDYSMELMSQKEGSEVRFSFYLNKGKDEVADAKVTAQFQMPDGSQKSLEMPFGAKEKAYVARLTSSVAGEYKVAVLTDLKGEKMNTRFTIKQ